MSSSLFFLSLVWIGVELGELCAESGVWNLLQGCEGIWVVSPGMLMFSLVWFDICGVAWAVTCLIGDGSLCVLMSSSLWVVSIWSLKLPGSKIALCIVLL